MKRLYQHKHKIPTDTERIQIIDINIPKAGKQVIFDTETISSVDEIIGIAIINPNPKQAGHGTLKLRIGDDEILPAGFHVDLISKFKQEQVDTKIEFGFREYLLPVKTKAQGKPVRIHYSEPSDGGAGKLHLYLFGCKEGITTNDKISFQVLKLTAPKGDNSVNMELAFNEKTLRSHKRVKGVMFMGPTNRIKEVNLSIDGDTIFPKGTLSQLVTKEIIQPTAITNGILTRHLIPPAYLMFPCDVQAENSKIEGALTIVPHPSEDYNIYLYLLTTV